MHSIFLILIQLLVFHNRSLLAAGCGRTRLYHFISWLKAGIMNSSERPYTYMRASMVTNLVDALSVSWVKCIPLTCKDQVVFRNDLVWVLVAARSHNCYPLVVNIKDKVVLSHQCAPNQHLWGVLHIKGNAIPDRVHTIQVLTWVPVEVIVFRISAYLESEDWKGPEVVVGSSREFLFAVAEA